MRIDEPLKIEDIDFRVQSINKGGYATILAYKDARVDMNRLDVVYGVNGWQKEYREIGGRLYCRVGVFSEKAGQWVWKEDVGTESNTEAEKGQASDAFKRACFNFGIGRELYDYPVIQVKLNGNGKDQKDEWYLSEYQGKQYPKAGWGLKLKEWSWCSQFKDGKISFLAAKDENGNIRFKWGKYVNESELKDVTAK